MKDRVVQGSKIQLAAWTKVREIVAQVPMPAVELVKLVQVQTVQPAVQVQVGGQDGQTSVMTKISISHGGKSIWILSDHDNGDAEDMMIDEVW